MPVRKPVLTLAMKPDLAPRLFTADQRRQLGELAETDPGTVLHDFMSAQAELARTEVLLTGWGCPPIDEAVLAAAPELRAVIHAGGSVKGHVTPACWTHGILVSSAAAANAQPVAEYTVAMVLLAGKATWQTIELYRERQGPIDREAEFADAGNYDRTVGVIGASRIGRRVLALLGQFDLNLLLSDPFADEAEAARLGARLVELDELMAASDIVSLHAPDLPSTRHLLDRRRLALLRDGATLINTSRGALVDQAALEAELASGRIHAVIDVTSPDVLPPGSPLYTMPNLMLTPHIAGSMGRELHRLAAAALAELARYTRGDPFRHPVAAAELWRVAL
jgi:phosphoglycerate dehydrogenase-like enzyme